MQVLFLFFFKAHILFVCLFLPSTKSLVPRLVPRADAFEQTKKKASHFFYIPTYYSAAQEYQVIIKLLVVVITTL